jgi:hypothetical protein
MMIMKNTNRGEFMIFLTGITEKSGNEKKSDRNGNNL